METTIAFFLKAKVAAHRGLVAEPLGYVVGALITAAATALALLAAPHATLAHVEVIYLLGAVLVAMRYGVAVSTFNILLSALCFDYFNIRPVFAFEILDLHSVCTLGGMLLATVVVCSLLQRLRFQRAAARSSEARTLALCELSLDLSEVTAVEALPRTAERHLVRLLGASVRVLLGHVLERRELGLLAAADGTLALQPILAGGKSLGVIRVGLAPVDPAQRREQQVLLAACADRIAVAVDRLTLRDAARRAQIDAEAERLRNELLSAMSHDLRTPLASIFAAGSTLLRTGCAKNTAQRELLQTMVDETDRLSRLVTNLLSVTRLESGKVRLNKAPDGLDDVVYGALQHLSGRLEGRDVEVSVPPDLPLVWMDSVLVDQVIVNLLENVLRYTPAGSPVAISMHATEEELSVEIGDRGPGIASEELEKVFEKFYRGRQAKQKDGGSGLGLTICRAIARAHGGRIKLCRRPGGGTLVEFALPRTEPERESQVNALYAANGEMRP